MRLERRISRDSPSTCIILLVPVFMIKTQHNQTNYNEFLPTFVQTDNATLVYERVSACVNTLSVEIRIQTCWNCMINNNVHNSHVYIPYDRPLWHSYRYSENQKPRISAKVRCERSSLNGLHFEILTTFEFLENYPRKSSYHLSLSVSG